MTSGESAYDLLLACVFRVAHQQTNGGPDLDAELTLKRVTSMTSGEGYVKALEAEIEQARRWRKHVLDLFAEPNSNVRYWGDYFPGVNADYTDARNRTDTARSATDAARNCKPLQTSESLAGGEAAQRDARGRVGDE